MRGTFTELKERLVPELAEVLFGYDNGRKMAAVQEVRLRVGQPVRLRLSRGERELHIGWSRQLQERQLMLFLDNSVYAHEEQLRRGFISLPGGHRVGLVGEAWFAGGELRGFKDIVSMNLRLARAVPGAAALFWPYLTDGGRVLRTLLASPPGVGKTTLLRDIVRGLSEGEAGVDPLNVGLADERMEIAAVSAGRPQLDVGSRCDVISACPKDQAVMLLLRSMGPQVIVCDEIGSRQDCQALAAALNAGVAVIASAHGASREELLARPWLGELIARGFFERLILLGRNDRGLRPIAVYDGGGGRLPC